jgi:hypothetical protein
LKLSKKIQNISTLSVSGSDFSKRPDPDPAPEQYPGLNKFFLTFWISSPQICPTMFIHELIVYRGFRCRKSSGFEREKVCEIIPLTVVLVFFPFQSKSTGKKKSFSRI